MKNAGRCRFRRYARRASTNSLDTVLPAQELQGSNLCSNYPSERAVRGHPTTVWSEVAKLEHNFLDRPDSQGIVCRVHPNGQRPISCPPPIPDDCRRLLRSRKEPLLLPAPSACIPQWTAFPVSPFMTRFNRQPCSASTPPRRKTFASDFRLLTSYSTRRSPTLPDGHYGCVAAGRTRRNTSTPVGWSP